MRTTKLLSVSLMPDFLEEIERVAKEEKRTKSELVREALRRYLAERQWEQLSRYAQIKATATGIATEEDIQRLIDASRSARRNA